MAERKGLGKGLGALLGDAAVQSPESGILQIPIEKVEPNANQPRSLFDEEALADLAESIARHGILQPLAVRRLPNGCYQIIAGERRWRAARIAGLREIPVTILEADDKKAMELALIENLQREDLNPVEEADGYRALIEEYGLTQEEAARQVGKSRPAVTNTLRLLSLPQSVRHFLEQGTLSAGHARAVLQLKSAEEQELAAAKIIDGELSVRQAEALVKRMSSPEKTPEINRDFQVDYIAVAEKELSSHLGRKVRIVNGRKKGRFELEFYGDEDLERLLEALQALELIKETSQ